MNTLLVANTIISKMHSYKKIIRPMKLQKLLFYSTGFYHKEYQEDLLDDDFCHYAYGPVIPLVYNTFNSYRGTPIEECAVFRFNDVVKRWILINDELEIAKNVHAILDKVISAYAYMTDLLLSKKTHNLPCWKETKDYEVMQKDRIYEDFENLEYGS